MLRGQDIAAIIQLHTVHSVGYVWQFVQPTMKLQYNSLCTKTHFTKLVSQLFDKKNFKNIVKRFHTYLETKVMINNLIKSNHLGLSVLKRALKYIIFSQKYYYDLEFKISLSLLCKTGSQSHT